MAQLTDFESMRAAIRDGSGFIAALDQSGGSTPKALRGYGVPDDAYADDEAMFALIHEMRSRIIGAPCFSGDRVIGAILFERTMDGYVAGVPATDALKARGVVPFIKIDQGLEAEANGAQLLKAMPSLDRLLARAKALGVFGTKARSVINHADAAGIGAIVVQQFDVAQQVLAHGMMPIIEPEVNIKSESRAQCDVLLRDAILHALDGLAAGAQVMLKLSLPVVAGTFDALVDHPRVLRVVALSGGYGRSEACAELSKNRGIIASFSRALLEDLRASMSEAEFDAALAAAISDIQAASAT